MPDFVDPQDDGPLPGREEDWGIVTGYRVRLAREDRQWAEAERLQTVCVDWGRRHATAALAQPEELEGRERHVVRTLAVSLEVLGNIRREMGRAECIPAYEEALELSERIGDRAEAANCTFNLGRTFGELPALRNLDQAERWYRRSLALHDESDRLGRGRCVGELGNVAHERFLAAQAVGQPAEELLRHLSEVMRLYHEALDLFPADAVNSLAVVHNQLGLIYRNAGDFDRAVRHFRESIHHQESQSNLYGAAGARFNIALALFDSGRRVDALEYAKAALRGYESYGERAEEEIEKTHGLITKIREA